MAITETTVTTDRARLSFTHLFEPYANNPGQDAKYSVTVFVPKADIATKQRIDAAETAAKRNGVSKCWNGTIPPVVAYVICEVNAYTRFNKFASIKNFQLKIIKIAQIF